MTCVVIFNIGVEDKTSVVCTLVHCQLLKSGPSVAGKEAGSVCVCGGGCLFVLDAVPATKTTSRRAGKWGRAKGRLKQ